MRKKFLAAALLAVTVALALCGFAGCGEESGGRADDPVLSYGKKYLKSTEISVADPDYMLFNRDGTGVFRYLYISGDFVSDYTITFRYFITEDVVTCFYDSVEYGKDNTEGNVYDSWSECYKFNSNWLSSLETGNVRFICESFLPQIPNYDK